MTWLGTRELPNPFDGIPPEGALYWKYADPIEDARWVYDERDATLIARDDPNLLVAISAECERADG